MVMKALEKHTTFALPGFGRVGLTFDASPSLLMMYMGLLKSTGARNSAGAPLVGDIRQIAMGDKDRPGKHLARNLYINAMEGRLFLWLFHINMVVRGYLETRYGDEGLQYLQPEMRQEIESWREAIFEDFRRGESASDNQLLVFKAEAERLGRVPREQRTSSWIEDKNLLMEMVENFLGTLKNRAREIHDSRESSFADIIRSGYRLELYLELEKEITLKLQ